NLQVWDSTGTQPSQTADAIYTAVNYVRQHQGPGLLRLTVPRLSGHSSVDNQAYKSEEVREAERANDPIPALHDYLVPSLLSEAEWESLVNEVKASVTTARDSARAQPQPEPASVTRFVFSEPGKPQQVGGLLAEGIQLPRGTDIPQPASPQRINMVEAIRH